MRTACLHCNVTRSCWTVGACEHAVERARPYGADEIELTTADMLEIAASGGNGSEYVDVPALMEKAAAELRGAADERARLRASLGRTEDSARELATACFNWSDEIKQELVALKAAVDEARELLGLPKLGRWP